MQKSRRLTKNEDFNKVYKRGKSFANRQFVLYVLANPEVEAYRLGISVSKKLGGAVIRNRIRRIVKELVRQHDDLIKGPADLILIARKPLATMTFQEMEKSLIHVLKRGPFPSINDVSEPIRKNRS